MDGPPAFGNGSLKRHLCSKRSFRNIFLKLPTRVCLCVGRGGGGGGEEGALSSPSRMLYGDVCHSELVNLHFFC